MIHIQKINQHEYYYLHKQLPLLMKEAHEYYPCFYKWSKNKVLAEIKKGFRHIYVAYDKKQPIGLSISKTDFIEDKLCTLWVDKDYQNNGIGTELLRLNLNLFNKTPIITIPEFKVSEFRSLTKKFYFKEKSVIKHLYQDGVNEVIYEISYKLKKSYNFVVVDELANKILQERNFIYQ